MSERLPLFPDWPPKPIPPKIVVLREDKLPNMKEKKMSYFKQFIQFFNNLLRIIGAFGGSSTTPTNPTPTPSDTDVYFSTDEITLLESHNKIRKQSGLNVLMLNEQLCKAARTHAEWMARSNVLSHAGNNTTVKERVLEAGYSAASLAENIASGYKYVESAMDGWFNSTGHRKNILGEFDDVGFGIAVGQKKFYCVVFGRKGQRLESVYSSQGIEK